LFEVIVIDNGSTDNTVNICETYLRKILNFRFTHEPIPGLHAGRHAGMKTARGGILVYSDDDIQAHSTWLEGIAETFKDPSAHLVGGRILPLYEGSPPEWMEAFWNTDEYGRLCGPLSLLDLGTEMKVIDPDYIWGLNYAIRKQSLLELGGFHPDAFPWELRRYRGDGETGLSRKAKKLGLRAMYQPKALIYHRIPAARMTVEYFKRRAFLQGISDSYTHIREKAEKVDIASDRLFDRKFSFDKAKQQIKHLFARNSFNRIKRIKGEVRHAYDMGYTFHQNEVRKDQELLQWVLKEDYWEYQLPA
jgi:glycosyltransferase involved in cell wall biosynthesis